MAPGREKCRADDRNSDAAGIAQLVEHNLAKVGVASSNLVSRSKFMLKPHTGGVFTLHGSRALAYRAEIQLFVGWVAEWLCSGLQSRVHRFDSGLSLQFFASTRPGWRNW